MSAESRARKQCMAEAKKELVRREKEQQASVAAQEVAQRKTAINGKLGQLQEERNRLIKQTVELRKTNPEAAKIIMAKGARIDYVLMQAQQALALADSLGIERQITDVLDDAGKLIRKLNTEPVRFMTEKELKKLAEETKIHGIMMDLADQRRGVEWGIYTGDVGSGVGSTFEADVLAAERQQQIEDIDD